jgi:PAS domain S-box-containing protein
MSQASWQRADKVIMNIGLIQNFSDLVVVLTMNAMIRDASASSEALLGHSPHSLRGRAFTEFLTADSAEELLVALRATVTDPSTGHFVCFKAVGQDGSWRHFEAIVRHSGKHLLKPELRLDARDVTAAARERIESLEQRGQRPIQTPDPCAPTITEFSRRIETGAAFR